MTVASFSTIPFLPSLVLSDDERATVGLLEMTGLKHRFRMELENAYYCGEYVVRSLGIALPKELQHLRAILGWPAKAVDPYVNRLRVDGFRLASATDSDLSLRDVWVENGMDGEQSLLFTDALAMGRGYVTVGSPEDPGDAPVICVESPLNMAVLWDLRYAKPKAALQTYWDDGQRHAALYLPDQTIHLAADERTEWEVTDRDAHGFGWVPVIRLANRARTNKRDGFSEITPAVRNLTDSASRIVVNLTVASELYSIRQKILLGATEADFQNADGTARSAWQTYMNTVLALERDDEGNVPEFHESTPYDPSVYTKVIDEFASQMAGEVAATPQELGLYTQGNPPSADAVQFAQTERNLRIMRMQGAFGQGLVQVMQMAVRFQNDGNLPAQFRRMEVDWAEAVPPSLAAVSDAIAKQVDSGIVPATSDVTLKRLGYSVIERARLAKDRDTDITASVEAQLASSIQVKQARADLTVPADVIAAKAPAKPAVPAVPSGPAK